LTRSGCDVKIMSTMAPRDKDRHEHALQVLSRIQRALVRRLSEYVTENEAGLRQAAEGGDGYGFVLQQMDELFLARLNMVERTIAELHKYPGNGASRYRALCFSVPKDSAEQAINSRLEQIPNARVLGVFANPASVRAHDEMSGDVERDQPFPDDSDLIVTVLYYGPTQAPEV
jgi:hypothetical protein